MKQNKIASTDIKSDGVSASQKNGWFGAPRRDDVGPYQCEVFELTGFRFLMKSRARKTGGGKEKEKKKETPAAAIETTSESQLEDLTRQMATPISDEEIRRECWQDPGYFDHRLYFDDSKAWPYDGLVYPGETIATREKRLKATVWITDQFERRLDDLLPIFEILSPTAVHFQRLHEFLTRRLPGSGFPVKLAIPVVPTVEGEATFEEYTEANLQPVDFTVPENFTLNE